jgi:hypothetical protein
VYYYKKINNNNIAIFKQLKQKHPNLNSVIIGTAIIMFWRGLWGLMDLYLFPNNEVMSYIVSVLLGLFLLFINDLRLKEIE